jgi:opacity protein-like surface antigen
MRYKTLSALIATAAFAPFVAQAEGLSYTFLEAGYLNTDIDEFDETVGGWGLKGSFEITDNIFAFANYADQSAEIGRGLGDIDLQGWDLGVGYAYPIAKQTDIYGTIGYVSVDADLPEWTEEFIDSDPEDNGYSLGLGIRTRFAERFEVEGTAQYANLSDFGDEFQFDFQGRWYITDMFALGVGYIAGDETSTFYGGVRMEFGN